MSMPARWTGIAGATALALTIALGLSGAARRPDALVVGVPGALAYVTAVAFTIALATLVRGLRPLSLGLGLAPLLLLTIVGAPRGFGAVTGPVLLVPALAVAVLALWRVRSPLAGRLFFPVILLTYLAIAAHLQHEVGPEGDGPHYLLVTQSLLRDHDLDLRRDIAEERYREFYAGPLKPHRRVRGRGGETFSLHAVGLSILLLPAFAVGGYAGASFFMALLAALLANEIRALIRAWCNAPALAEGVGWVVAFSPPLIYYAGTVFTEVPAALLIAVVLHYGRDLSSSSSWKALGIGTAIACLPWLNVRYGIPAACLLAFVLCARPCWRLAVSIVGPALASALALGLYHHILYGFLDPRRVYGRHPEGGLAYVPNGLLGLLLDQEFGLLAYAPVFVFALPGLLVLWRFGWRLAATVGALTATVLFAASAWPMWRGGFNPPARFLVPLVPVLALAIAAALRGGRRRVGVALLVGWGLWTGAAGALEPRLVHRDRDGTAPLFRATSGASEWTLLLPGFVRPPSTETYSPTYTDRGRLAALWCAALALAVFGPTLPWRTTRRFGAAILGLIAAAGLASALSTGLSEGRDAVRCLGQRALALPGCYRASDAVWDASDLSWGGDYRGSLGRNEARIGARLPLAAGRYLLTLDVAGPSAGRPPQLVVTSEGPHAGRRTQPLLPAPAGLQAPFDVMPGESAVTLALRGGTPMQLTRVQLSALVGPRRPRLPGVDR